jgi:hypothetical protein
MKKTIKAGVLFLSIVAILAGCKKEKNSIIPDGNTNEQEYEFVRVLTSDEVEAKVSLIDPFTKKVSSFEAKYPLANLYATASGSYAVALYGSQNLVEVFDSGLSAHDDHIDVFGPAKWTGVTANGLKPTHFKSKATESLIFNDGDGTLSVGNEADFGNASAKFKTVNPGLLAHHGAMAQFDNGNYAVTATNEAGKSPTKVVIIDKNGATIKPSTQDVGAIHGNASDGEYAVFGAFTTPAATAGCVLVVAQDGTQKVIQNPENFGAFRLGTILYASKADKFVGFVATKGAYLVDVKSDQITPIYSGTDAFQCKIDYAGNNLLVLTLDGKLRVYNLNTGKLIKEGNAISAVATSDSFKPVLEATAKYAYIAMPSLGEVHQINLADFSKVTKHKVTAKPVRLALFGFETSEKHN